MIRILGLITAVILSTGNAAGHEQLSARSLEQTCQHQSRFSEGVCSGYIRSHLDLIKANGLERTLNLCVPDDVPISERTAAIRKFMTENKEALGQPASLAILSALRRKYPCRF
jgi:hypothetical protein